MAKKAKTAKKVKPIKKVPVKKAPVRKLPPPIVKVEKAVVIQTKEEPKPDDAKKKALFQKIMELKNQKANGHEVRADQLDELAAMIEK